MKDIDAWNSPAFDGKDRTTLYATQSAIERRAQKFFHDLKNTHIPDAIIACVEERRYVFGLTTCSWNLNTIAFLHFREWLSQQGLTCVCSQALEGAADDPDADIVLHFLPEKKDAICSGLSDA